jgi:uncharacterized damage-inducible protein DinB
MISQSLLPEFDQEMANTRKVLDRVPDDKLTWKPHEKSYSMGRLAGHVANLIHWTELTLQQDKFDLAPPAGQPNLRPEPTSRKEILEAFEKNVTRARILIEKTSDADFMKPWSLLKSGQKIFTIPRIVVLRSFVMNHEIHHRAQLIVYLRLNNIPVPGLYGPSADEA